MMADVSMDMPDVLDISHLRGAGKQPGEEELADAAPPAAPGIVFVLSFLCFTMFLSQGSLCVTVMCNVIAITANLFYARCFRTEWYA